MLREEQSTEGRKEERGGESSCLQSHLLVLDQLQVLQSLLGQGAELLLQLGDAV